MSVRTDGDTIFLEGDCGVEDAEPLVNALESGVFVRVDIALCRHLHSAVVQALLVFPCRLEGGPTEGFLPRFVLPALAESHAQQVKLLWTTENSMESPE